MLYDYGNPFVRIVDPTVSLDRDEFPIQLEYLIFQRCVEPQRHAPVDIGVQNGCPFFRVNVEKPPVDEDRFRLT